MANQPEQITDLTPAPVAVVGEVQYIPAKENKFFNTCSNIYYYYSGFSDMADVLSSDDYIKWLRVLFPDKD
jgi:hypothetical protein